MRNIICILALFFFIPNVYAIEIERLSVSSAGSETNNASRNLLVSAGSHFAVLANSFPKTQLLIDRNNGKYWATNTIVARNTGSQPTSVNLSITSILAMTSKRSQRRAFVNPLTRLMVIGLA